MSNFQTNEDLSQESRTSFVTVSSMIAGFENEKKSDKPKEEINLNSKNLINNLKSTNQNQTNMLKNESLMSVSMSNDIENTNFNLTKNYSSGKDKFEDLPLQYSSSERVKKSIIPHLIVEDKGEKRD